MENLGAACGVATRIRQSRVLLRADGLRFRLSLRSSAGTCRSAAQGSQAGIDLPGKLTLLLELLLLAFSTVANGFLLRQSRLRLLQRSCVSEAIKGRSRLPVFAPGFVSVPCLLQTFRASNGFCLLLSNEALILRLAILLHSDQTEPGKGLLHHVGRSPLVSPVKVTQ